MKHYIDFWKRAFDFSGVASRVQYWVPSLINTAIIVVLICILLSESVALTFIISAIYLLVMIIPSISVTVRRLHDINMSGWLYLVNFIPGIGEIIVFVLMCLPTVKEGNMWRIFDIQRGYIRDEFFQEPLAKEEKWVYRDYDEK